MKHTEEEIVVMKEYHNATDSEVKAFVEDILTGREVINYVTVAFLSSRAAIKIKQLTGKNVAGNRVVLDINAVKHIANRHGINGKQDHSMKDINDIARIGYVIMNFDDITYNGEISYNHMDECGNPSPKVEFSKKIDGTIYVVQTVSEVKSKKNYIITAYINKKQPPNP